MSDNGFINKTAEKTKEVEVGVNTVQTISRGKVQRQAGRESGR